LLQVQFPDREEVWRAKNAAVISLKPGAPVPEELRATGRALGTLQRHWLVEPHEGQDGLSLAVQWARHPDVDAALPDLVLDKVPASFDDPGHGGQWYYENLEMAALHERSLGDPSVRIAVIDSGIDITHPDLAASVVAPLDLVDGDEDPTPQPGDECNDGETGLCDTHGTSVSGITNAIANNGVGIVGFCPNCSLVPIRLLGGDTSLAEDILAFEHAYEQDVAVVNNSWGYAQHIPAPAGLAEVIGRVTLENRGGLGAVVVFAAGNEDRRVEPDEMTALPSVLCISATDTYDLPTAYTNSGRPVDIAAPSATVTITPNNGMTEIFGGTSASAPVVSGFVGWLLSNYPDLSTAEVEELLTDTAYKIPIVTFNENGHHEVYGHGLLDPMAVVARLDAPPEPVEEVPEGCGCDSRASSPALWGGVGALLVLLRRRSR
jgi:serine protease